MRKIVFYGFINKRKKITWILILDLLTVAILTTTRSPEAFHISIYALKSFLFFINFKILEIS